MKKVITTAFLTVATVLGFAQDAIPEVLPQIVRLETAPVISIQEKVIPSKSFGYLSMGVSDSELKGTTFNSIPDQIVPGLRAGYRLASKDGSSALDFSASYNRREVTTAGIKEYTYLYTVPKANYLYYINADSNNSFYAGGGLAVGGVKTDTENFVGIIPNVAVGVEMNRKGTLRSFAQFDVSQPAIAAVKEGNLPKVFAELSVGAGF